VKERLDSSVSTALY